MFPSTLSRGNIRTLGKTKLTVSLGTIHQVYIVSLRTSVFPEEKAKGNIEVVGKQNSLFPTNLSHF